MFINKLYTCSKTKSIHIRSDAILCKEFPSAFGLLCRYRICGYSEWTLHMYHKSVCIHIRGTYILYMYDLYDCVSTDNMFYI